MPQPAKQDLSCHVAGWLAQGASLPARHTHSQAAGVLHATVQRRPAGLHQVAVEGGLAYAAVDGVVHRAHPVLEGWAAADVWRVCPAQREARGSADGPVSHVMSTCMCKHSPCMPGWIQS